MSIQLRLGTRGSLLARTQSQMIADEIEHARPDVKIELIIVKTTGDQIQDKPLADIGGKGLFTRELEQALLRHEIDLAVHSFKDVPITMPLVDQTDLAITATTRREDPSDVLITQIPGQSIHDLPKGARIGTSSLRRKCQLLAIRNDLQILPIRGNIDTRLKKITIGEFDATILALAGLKRVGLFDASIMQILPLDLMLSSPGQGALAIQTRASDTEAGNIVSIVNDTSIQTCVAIEREVVQLLKGDCHSPIAALATIEGDQIRLRIAVGETNGELPVKKSENTTPITEINHLADQTIAILV